MKLLFIFLLIIVIAALAFGYFGYQPKHLINIPLVVAAATGITALLVQWRDNRRIIQSLRAGEKMIQEVMTNPAQREATPNTAQSKAKSLPQEAALSVATNQ